MTKTEKCYVIVFILVGLWSAIGAYEGVLWILEAFPCLIGMAVLVLTYNRFRFTSLTYFFILIHFTILFVGAHYTYARVPVFDWFSDWFNWSRNNYDKVGHFAQGFVPAMIARELLIRLNIVRKRGWISFFVASICLAISALYEIFEWFVAVVIQQSADDFLGMQGYEWDTQSDMLFALLGALTMLIFWSRIQDRQIRELANY